MSDDTAYIRQQEALAMINAFASVGATRFDITWTNAAGIKQSFRRDVSIADLARILLAALDQAISQRHNLIVRPASPDTTFIQLDDLKAHQLPLITPAVFLILETSRRFNPETWEDETNHQAWLAITGRVDEDFIRRLKRGTGADKTASGATRIAGSLNFKDKYAPDFPRVKIVAAHFSRMTTTADLDRLGLVEAPEPVAEPPRISPARSRPTGSNRKWPNYARCLEGARPQAKARRERTGRASPISHGALSPQIGAGRSMRLHGS